MGTCVCTCVLERVYLRACPACVLFTNGNAQFLPDSKRCLVAGSFNLNTIARMHNFKSVDEYPLTPFAISSELEEQKAARSEMDTSGHLIQEFVKTFFRQRPARPFEYNSSDA